MTLWLVLQINLAFILDLLIGDPPKVPHPVVIMGKVINKLEAILRKKAKSPLTERIAGILLVMIIVGGSFYITIHLLELLSLLNKCFSFLIGAWIMSTTIAVKGLAKEGRKIKALLEVKDIKEARKQVGYIVGRDTDRLDEKELIRATVETIAENIVDAVISPLFYGMIGGPALAIAYRSSNTLDSMCGYKNEKYQFFGWASARFDDLLNYIPARITGILLIIAIWVLRFKVKAAIYTWKRDAQLHPSPNSGIPESVVAGALGIRLGGINYYFGQAKKRAFLGDNLVSLQQIHIQQTINLLYLSSLLFIIFYNLVLFIIIFF